MRIGIQPLAGCSEHQKYEKNKYIHIHLVFENKICIWYANFSFGCVLSLFKQHFEALFDLQQTGIDQLSFKKGDHLVARRSPNPEWYYGYIAGQKNTTGYIPYNYIRPQVRKKKSNSNSKRPISLV